MQELIRIIIGVVVLGLGIPIGNYLARLTKEELKPGKKWFSLIILLALIGAVFALIFRNDALLFGLLFIVTKGIGARLALVEKLAWSRERGKGDEYQRLARVSSSSQR